MAIPKDTVWDLDPHTRAKHEILRRYLNAWIPILNTWHSRIVYIDGFAGPGRYRGGEPGSPIIALDVAMNHRRAMKGELVFWFIDERRDRVEHLQRELENLNIPSHFHVSADCGRFDEKLKWLLDEVERTGDRLAPTFAFIDPFGFSGIPFALVERLLKYPRCEAFVTFMIDAVNRFLEHPEPAITGDIVELFGTDEVIRIARTAGDRTRKLRALYQSQLKRAARFVRYFEMRDHRDRSIYYLFFATNHELGHVRMKDAMWQVDQQGEFRFSDATDPHQAVLFDADPAGALAEDLRRRFAGCSRVAGEQVRKYVEDETAYLKKHMTAALRAEEAAGRLRVEPTKFGGARRKAGTYPDDALMAFL